MAEIKDFFKEREKRERKQENFEDRIRKHKRVNLYRVLTLLAVMLLLVALLVVQYKRHIYTGYDILSSVPRQKSLEAIDTRLGNAVLTYSKDGAHCTSAKGNVNWDQTYEISDLLLSKCQDVSAIAHYNGRDIYVQSVDKQLGQITTNLPIKNIAVSAKGTVTVILEDSDVTWINTYNADGEILYTGQAHMDESGYPAAISLSPNGELLAIAYVYVEAGKLATKMGFYNFGPVGANQSDYLVSTYIYEDMLIPELHFMDDETAFAVGDNRLMIYKGLHKPETYAERILSKEIRSVFYNEKYIGLVFVSNREDAYYTLEVYNTAGTKVADCNFDMDYRNIFFDEDNIVIYNETDCLIHTLSDIRKFEGSFGKTINLILPTGAKYRYMLVTDTTIDTIQLK